MESHEEAERKSTNAGGFVRINRDVTILPSSSASYLSNCFTTLN